ncbi:hypothetical protein IMG5_166960 [Ichthyophthirius multifiliis]|uniref:Arginase n=1 Tax=Ichthyophthirius multifiliis TaxID=5932 RepID=G0R0U2_ICHMU|nr:hypothetical protein IMG5_166960 [Ichthyophthirius multifiliis]EGR28902.1 hypothetical protein IMG5_166960 [Ichthyophthirius multifiliis]|eukprot:XP_004030138.1 hypothetical protein IMG5_166960 [Ichthyophthirius multifiliis]
MSNKPTNKLIDIIHEGLDGKISLIGYPYDIGAKREKIQQGQEDGPDCLRRFLNKVGSIVNYEYQIDISNLKISDYGNIYIQGNKDQTSEDLINKLQLKISSVFKKGNIPFLIGGSKECSFGIINQFYGLQGSHAIISISQNIDVDLLFDGDKLSINSGMRKFFIENQQKLDSNNFKVQYFGAQSQTLNITQLKFIQENQSLIQLHYLNLIRQYQINPSQNLRQPSTQACQYFLFLLKNHITQSNIHLSLSLEAINSACCPGVSRPSVIGGLTSEEIIEIMFQAGIDERIKSIDITDYNPNIEDYRTGLLLANLIYYYCLGYCERLKKE